MHASISIMEPLITKTVPIICIYICDMTTGKFAPHKLKGTSKDHVEMYALHSTKIYWFASRLMSVNKCKPVMAACLQ